MNNLENNPNDSTAQIYDRMTNPLKGQAVTDSEITLINFLAEPGGSILDIGAGTGRHAVILAQLDYKVTAIDSSKKMLAELKEKAKDANVLKKIKIISGNILKTNLLLPTSNFELIILMWNSFNEICLTKPDAIKLLKMLKKLLVQNGRIIINIDDANLVDPSNFNFSTEYFQNNKSYKVNWTTRDYDKKTNTSISKEKVSIFENGELLEEKTSLIKQRYWNSLDIKKIAESLGFVFENRKLRTSTEDYIILSF